MAELTVIEPEPIDHSVIAALESILAEARAGNLSSVAIAFVRRDGTTGSEWSQIPWRAPLLGAVAILQHDLAGA